ncbi:MAG TPA: hypothetical protein VGS21_07535 [Acidimicrobiales bacterium]|nr:hypothetical protein [Acidimicrobiales bacterium]
MRPFLFHCHGIGEYDFSHLTSGDLQGLDQTAGAREWTVLATIYLRRDYLDQLTEVLEAYRDGRREGRFGQIAGFAMEGPLLGPAGGIPPAGCWLPTGDEWRRIAALGPAGLRYIVMGPDAMDLDDEIEPGFSFGDLIALLYENGIIVAIGHFRRDDPQRSARRTEEVIGFVQDRFGPSPNVLVTDHLFNDMPRTFVHAWRTSEARAHRDEALAVFLATPWTDNNIDTLLGVVPAAIIRAARHGHLTPCLNFDGEHVDLDIQARAARFIGPDALIAITDNTEAATMAGEPLFLREGSGLWWRGDGLVAAGSGDVATQVANMQRTGFSAGDIEAMLDRVPRRVIAASDEMRQTYG